MRREVAMDGGDEKEKASTSEIASTVSVVIAVDSAAGGSSGFRIRETLSIDGNDVVVTAAGEAGKVNTGGRQEKGGWVAVDVEGGGGDRESEGASVCRICHLNADLIGSEGLELIDIGCGCRGDIGAAHRCCAEVWFMVRGSRLCEICGLQAKNVVGKGDTNGFLEAWNEGRRLPHSQGSTDQGSSCARQSLCSFLLSFLVIVFILQWYFRTSFG